MITFATCPLLICSKTRIEPESICKDYSDCWDSPRAWAHYLSDKEIFVWINLSFERLNWLYLLRCPTLPLQAIPTSLLTGSTGAPTGRIGTIISVPSKLQRSKPPGLFWNLLFPSYGYSFWIDLQSLNRYNSWVSFEANKQILAKLWRL